MMLTSFNSYVQISMIVDVLKSGENIFGSVNKEQRGPNTVRRQTKTHQNVAEIWAEIWALFYWQNGPKYMHRVQ